MKTGIELIAQERSEHFTKHLRTVEMDVLHNPNGELLMAADALINNKYGMFPDSWFNGTGKAIIGHMMRKSQTERLALAGSFIAAEIDRLNAIQKQGNEE